MACVSSPPTATSTSRNSRRITTEFRFHAVHLWEQAERIRTGELAELAPLLPLCEEKPGEHTVRLQRQLIRSLTRSDEEIGELFGLSMLIGSKRLSKALIQRIFKEELQMAKISGIIGDWMEESRAEGRAEGHSLGRTETAREFALRLLQERYPQLPEAVIARVGREGVEWCEELAVRLVRGEPLADIGL